MAVVCWELYLIPVKICILHSFIVLRVTNAVPFFIPAALGRRKQRQVLHSPQKCQSTRCLPLCTQPPFLPDGAEHGPAAAAAVPLRGSSGPHAPSGHLCEYLGATGEGLLALQCGEEENDDQTERKEEAVRGEKIHLACSVSS